MPCNNCHKYSDSPCPSCDTEAYYCPECNQPEYECDCEEEETIRRESDG